MRPPRIFRTSSFRLTLLYAAVFSASVLVLLGVVYWLCTSQISRQLEQTVTNQLNDVLVDAAGRDLNGMRDIVAPLAVHAPFGLYYMLQDASGRVIAGNGPSLRPVNGVQTWSHRAHTQGHKRRLVEVWGRGVPVADGGYLYVGVDNFEVNELQELITLSFLWALGATVVLALGGGVVMSLSLLKRVEAISQTSRRIVAGDLSQRIAQHGTDDEFDHLAASLNAMLERIQGLMDGLQQVSNDIAHDLRTPLSRLRQRLEFALRREQTVESLRAALEDSVEDVDRILDTFSALLHIAQIEARAQPPSLSTIDLSELLANVADAYQAVAEERGQHLVPHIAPGLRVQGDAELLPQLYSNLVENAIRHCPEGARIEVHASAGPLGIRSSVADNGPGIPEPMRDRVLERFFRLERSRTTPGTGLGLSLANAIATLHGVHLTLADNLPGLRVELQYPPA